MRYLPVKNCKECPRRAYATTDKEHCRDSARHFSKKDLSTEFPEWCPLETVEIIANDLNTECLKKEEKQDKKAIKEFKKNIEEWRDNTTKSLKDVYDFDRERLQSVYDAYVKKDYEIAATLAGRLDTILRDQIPRLIYYRIFSRE